MKNRAQRERRWPIEEKEVKALSEVKPVKNISKNLQSFLERWGNQQNWAGGRGGGGGGCGAPLCPPLWATLHGDQPLSTTLKNSKEIRNSFHPIEIYSKKTFSKTLMVAAYDCFFIISLENWFFKKSFISRSDKKNSWKKLQVWGTQFTSCSSVDMEKYFIFFSFSF